MPIKAPIKIKEPAAESAPDVPVPRKKQGMKKTKLL
jgi:hypothetical protein